MAGFSTLSIDRKCRIVENDNGLIIKRRWTTGRVLLDWILWNGLLDEIEVERDAKIRDASDGG